MTKTFKFKVPRQGPRIPLPSRPRLAREDEEVLVGEVKGMKASAPEERLAKELDKAGIQYEFRYVVGAPKGLPGWKELDFLVSSGGLLYALEVDTAFTHMSKENADKLHDAIIQNDRNLKELGELWPEVIHVDGDSDLSAKESARQFVKRQFGR